MAIEFGRETKWLEGRLLKSGMMVVMGCFLKSGMGYPRASPENYPGGSKNKIYIIT